MQALAKQEVGDFLTQNFVSVYDKIGTFQMNVDENGTAQKNGGNVAAFFCTPKGYVIHVAAGPRTGEAFLAEAKWALAVHSQILADRTLGKSQARIDQVSRVTAALRWAHTEAFKSLSSRDPNAPRSELVWNKPPADPALNGLDEAGRRQRTKVHELLASRAYEPLTNVGPLVYTMILGERVTHQPVQLNGEVDAKQGARTGQTLLEFFNQRATDK